jgi:hypothetical protein
MLFGGRPIRWLMIKSYVPSGQIHAGRNTSRTEAFEFLLFRIHVKSRPISIELN